MKTRSDLNAKTNFQLKVGSVLVAQPFWMEFVFRHAVILITDYDVNGTSGIIINKASNISLNEVLPDVKVNDRLYYGGPDTFGSYSFIHNIPSIPEADYFGNGIYFGGDPARIEEMIIEQCLNFEKIKFYSGTVQWNVGQLESEIGNNKWWLSQVTAREMFGSSSIDLWSSILLNDGNIYGMFPVETFDPYLN